MSLTQDRRPFQIGGVASAVASLAVMAFPTWPVEPRGDVVPQPRGWWDPWLISDGKYLPLVALLATLVAVGFGVHRLVTRRPDWPAVSWAAIAAVLAAVAILVHGASSMWPWLAVAALVGAGLFGYLAARDALPRDRFRNEPTQ